MTRRYEPTGNYGRRVLDITQARRPILRELKRRIVVDGEKTYSAYDAHQLLEATSAFDRPGHLVP